MFAALACVLCLTLGCEDESATPAVDPIKDHPGKFIELTEANFDEKVLQAEGIVMVDFWNVTCQPCIEMAPWVAEISNEYDGRVVVGKLNTLKHVKTADNYRARTVPQIIFFKDGEPAKFKDIEGNEVDRLGYASKEEMTEVLDLLLARESAVKDDSGNAFEGDAGANSGN